MIRKQLQRNGIDDRRLKITNVLRHVDDGHTFAGLDTGIGVRGYTIVEQGRIAEIVSAKADERRILIEEAAGISKYKARRRQMQLKLEAAQQNLLRVNDIINEVEKQLERMLGPKPGACIRARFGLL